jgi:heme-degrading monooxygenase HmoA
MARSSPLSMLRWAATSSLAVALAACAHAPPVICSARIARTWHGRVPNARADEYDGYITGAITKFRTIPGNRGYQLMRETVGDETHFSVTSYWDSREAIHGYAGEDITKVRPLPRDSEFLIDPEPTVRNYDLTVLNIDCPK